MRVMLTGGTGFVGGAVAQALALAGHEVRALVRSPEHAGALASLGLTVVRGSLADPNEIALAARGCTHAVHAAAETAPGASRRVAGWVNLAGTENALAGARHAGVTRFVHVSCADVTLHGGPRRGWNEDRVANAPPLGPLLETKLRAEEAVIGAGTARFETLVLRPGTVWGAGDTSRLPRLCREALAAGGLPLFGDGRNLVALVHVENLAHAVLRALSTDGAAGSVLHVLDPELALAGEHYAELSAAVGLPAPRRGRLGARAAFVRARLAKARRVPGRRARASEGPDLAEIARRAFSASLDGQRAVRQLGYAPPVSRAQGMEALALWARRLGGASALAALERGPLSDAELDANIAAVSTGTEPVFHAPGEG